MDDIKTVTKACKDCSEVKASFHKPQDDLKLIKATQPFERISLDFKGPLDSCSQNKYMLVIVDEYSRFPFVYACKDMKTSTVIKKLTDLLCVSGFPSYIHSDQGSNFMSYEFKSWLHSKGIPTSRTTRYNPRGNGQVERYNGIIWKTVLLALRSKQLPPTHWEYVLEEALHSIRSLLCTATNCTPHERMFCHTRKLFSGVALPSWIKPGPVYVKRHNRNKYDLLVEEAELLEANPHYAHVRLEDGREITVSLRDLAPNPALPTQRQDVTENMETDGYSQNETRFVSHDAQTNVEISVDEPSCDSDVAENPDHSSLHESTFRRPNTPPLRRSSRVRRPVERYGDPVSY